MRVEPYLLFKGGCAQALEFYPRSLGADVAALADGGTVQVSMLSTPFASWFGMIADRIGVLGTVVKPQHRART